MHPAIINLGLRMNVKIFIINLNPLILKKKEEEEEAFYLFIFLKFSLSH